MEVKLQKRYALAVPAEKAWALLSDIRASTSCLPGAAITEQLDDTHFKAQLKTQIGPAAMNFQGTVELLSEDADAHRVALLGKGDDGAGTTAAMQLTAWIEPGATAAESVLTGEAVAAISGKLAVFGSRLMMMPTAEAMLARYVENFQAAAAVMPVAAAKAPAITATAKPAQLWPLVKRLFAGSRGKRA